jgi:hypothetical protein
MTISKWTLPEIEAMASLSVPGIDRFGTPVFPKDAARHILALQEAVEEFRAKDSYNGFFGTPLLDSLFWPADTTPELDDPDDNVIGHEW